MLSVSGIFWDGMRVDKSREDQKGRRKKVGDVMR